MPRATNKLILPLVMALFAPVLASPSSARALENRVWGSNFARTTCTGPQHDSTPGTHWVKVDSPTILASECLLAPRGAFKTWNQFQAGTKGQFASRAEAAKAWNAYKAADGIVTGTVRSQAAKSQFLKQLAESGNAPKWMNQWLRQGKVPPGHQVDHLKALSAGGADVPANMRLKDIATHGTRHRYYRPWE